MKSSIKDSIFIHIAILASLLLGHLSTTPAKVVRPQPADLQIVALSAPSQSAHVRPVRVKPVKLVNAQAQPTTLCAGECISPTRHVETFTMAQQPGVIFRILLPNGTHLTSPTQSADGLQVVADGSVKPGIYLVPITVTSESPIPDGWEQTKDPIVHFTYVRVNGPGIIPISAT
jgi:hypothetical protein